MQPIDPHTLFSIFEQGDEQIYQEHNITGVLDNPYVLMGMVCRGLENYHIMDMMYLKQYPKEYTNVRKVTKHKYITRLYNYLTRINLNEYGREYSIGDSYEYNNVKSSLEYIMFYFEKLEVYEKCAVVKKYIDLLDSKVEMTLI